MTVMFHLSLWATSAGEIVKIGGIECYVATPTVDYPKDKVVLFLPDGFGHVLVNAQVRDPSLRLPPTS